MNNSERRYIAYGQISDGVLHVIERVRVRGYYVVGSDDLSSREINHLFEIAQTNKWKCKWISDEIAVHRNDSYTNPLKSYLKNE